MKHKYHYYEPFVCLQVDILHYQLSACHILVETDLTCKITNFSTAENVRNRQRLAMEHDVTYIYLFNQSDRKHISF